MVQAVLLDDGNGQATNGTNGHAVMEGETPMPKLNTLPPPDMNWAITLKDKVIAITGANRGIGLGIAEVCLANGAACVYSLDLMEPSEEFATLSKKNQGRFRYQQMDVTKEESVKKAIDDIVEAEGAIHGMVCNAGMTKHQPALDFTMEQVEQLFRLNVFGAFACATAAARKFISLGVKGSIVFTASMTSYRPNRAAPSAPYGGTKAAVRNMTHTLAMEWAEHGIRVNSISPGFVKTAMTYYVEKAPDWDLKMQYYGGMPRLALPQELGGAYVYLLSDMASYTTGTRQMLSTFSTMAASAAPQTKISLSGKVIAITGANQGIGLGIAECCLSNDAQAVYSLDIGEVGDEFLSVSKRYAGKLHAVKADVTKEATVTEAVDGILKEAGGLHGFVVNAGRTKHKPALDFTTEEIEQLWNVNLYGSLYCARVAARAFIEQKAMEWAQYDIRVNSVSPGLVKTAVTYWVEKQPDWEQQLKYYGGLPRLAEVSELGGAYVYLLSDAASYTTSIDIPVNGVIGSGSPFSTSVPGS
ncbi:hypothetical protein LTR85_011140 [Meristemomyces frigidus]|nr:hypothetical protein LTR85_011140 [Meristemomyces frigidus]